MNKANWKDYAKKLILSAILLVVAVFLIEKSYGLWDSRTDVRFRLTISWPENGDDCICGKYTTIQEGIILLRDVQYNKLYSRMDAFEAQLRERIQELNNLPFGGITFDELSQERDYYMNVVIKGFRDCVNTFGSCINGLAKFYNNSAKEEKDKVSDFWDQHKHLWDLSDDLWDRIEPLYDVVNEFWEAGNRKIDY